MASNSKVIGKAVNKGKKYVGARNSCAWINFRPNTGSSAKHNPARPSRSSDLEKLMVESKEAHKRDIRTMRSFVRIEFAKKTT